MPKLNETLGSVLNRGLPMATEATESVASDPVGSVQTVGANVPEGAVGITSSGTGGGSNGGARSLLFPWGAALALIWVLVAVVD